MDTSIKMDELVQNLILAVRKNQVLYKPNYKGVEWNTRKEIAWETIAKCIDLPVDICKKKWKGLRDTYKKRKRESTKNDSEIPVKKWKYFDIMKFIDESDEDLTELSTHVFGNTTISYMDQDFEEILCDITADTQEVVNVEPINITQVKQENPVIDPTIMSQLIDAVKTSIKSEQRDSTSLLFASLASKLTNSNLTPSKLNEIECKIIAIVYEAISK